MILNDDGGRPYFLRNLEVDEPFSPQEFARLAVEPYLDRNIDTLFWTTADGNVFPTRMTTAERFGGDPSRDLNEVLDELAERERRSGQAQSKNPELPAHSAVPEEGRRFALQYIKQCRRLWSEDTDDLDLVVREGHKHGLEVFASVRMNDGHFMSATAGIEWCQLNRDHPEFNLDGPRTLFDFGHPEIRDWRFGHIQELAQKWDVDGIELDFIRFPVYFKEPAAEKAPLMTELIGRMRSALDEAGQRRGRPILLAVRPLETLEASLAVGLDVGEWLRQGWIDLLIGGGGYMTMDAPIEQLVAAGHAAGCPVYPCLSYPRSDAYLWGWAANTYPKGGDGLYLYNIFAPSTDLPVYRELSDPANLVGKSKLFDAQHRFINCPWHSDKMIWRPALPLPQDLSGSQADFPIVVHDDLEAAAARGVRPRASLRLTIVDLYGEPLEVRVNGHLLRAGPVAKDTPAQRELAGWEVPVAQRERHHMAKLLAPTHEYPVPLEWLLNGSNRIEIQVPYGQANWVRNGGLLPLAVTLAAASLLLDYSA